MFDIFTTPDTILTSDTWSRTVYERSQGKKEIVFVHKKTAFTAITFYQDSPFYEIVTLESKCPHRLPLPRELHEFGFDLKRCNITY